MSVKKTIDLNHFLLTSPKLLFHTKCFFPQFLNLNRYKFYCLFYSEYFFMHAKRQKHALWSRRIVQSCPFGRCFRSKESGGPLHQQGCFRSPILFITIMDWISAAAKGWRESGWGPADFIPTLCRWCASACFLLPSPTALMRISSSKSKGMFFNQKKVARLLQVAGEFLPHVEDR